MDGKLVYWETSVNSHSPIIPTVLIILVLHCIGVRVFQVLYGNKYKHFSFAGVWKWDLIVSMKTRAMMTPVLKLMMTVALKTTKTVITIMLEHTTKSRDYQSALKKARDMLRIRQRQYVPVSLVPEPTNPRDSKALAFVCMIVMANNTQLDM